MSPLFREGCQSSESYLILHFLKLWDSESVLRYRRTNKRFVVTLRFVNGSIR